MKLKSLLPNFHLSDKSNMLKYTHKTSNAIWYTGNNIILEMKNKGVEAWVDIIILNFFHFLTLVR